MSSGVEGAGPRAQKNPRGRISSEAHTSRKKQSRFPAWAKHPAFQIAVGAIGGVIFGMIVGDWAANLDFVGKIFIRLIQMSIVPLVLASIITATGSMSGSGMGRMAFHTFKWMLSFSAVLAWGLASLLKPGAGMTFDDELALTYRGRRRRAGLAGYPARIRHHEHL